MRIRLAALFFVTLTAVLSGHTLAADWQQIQQQARGQTVYFNAWGGSETINDYIRWAGKEVNQRYGIKLEQVKINDAADVVSRILAEKTAGRTTDGTVDLIWINGENFRAMKANSLLYGPFTQDLPNYALVDTEHKITTLYDFTTPVDNLEAPWGMAQLVFMYDSARISQPPRSMTELLAFARQHPGRMTYPAPPAFHGTTFLKQALYELAQDPKVLSKPVSEVDFDQVTKPLWDFLDQLHPLMWRQGKTFTSGSAEMQQLLNDGEIDISLSFNPNDASNAINSGELPDSIRSYVHRSGTIANTHFVAIPFNASAKAAAMVVADFLMSPQAQAHKADTQVWGDPTVLSMDKLSSADKALFDALPAGKAALSAQDLANVIPEPHVSWVEPLEQAWQQRYAH
ncbi:ABC transporter substrate-binding protein [Gynuella sunshinyii]|uniref:ABC-type uncharacterized transport system, periplasmic component n=1 Tax=Gynuella sunshinyii YC6258 TaxID=1445510 RepID=A0A0C5VH10_9GAMM|nr:ABC transporter substrate-binding protein [Gynuella sunshinyii]AJQ93907.1 ABC-type uncharacterized transport system, periplasmic component [Gynuella sunshinyii YC6258]